MTRLAISRGLLAAAFSIAMIPAAASAQQFEGVITMRMSGGPRSGNMMLDAQYSASRMGKARVDLSNTPAGAVAIIMSPVDKKMYLLMEQQSAYVEQALENLTGMPTTGEAAKVTRTGKMDTVAGTECEHLKVDELDICVTKSLGTYLNFGGNMMQGGILPWQNAMLKEGVFPLKVTLPDGTVQMEVTKIERKAVEPTMFQVPANYTKIQMPGRGG